MARMPKIAPTAKTSGTVAPARKGMRVCMAKTVKPTASKINNPLMSTIRERLLATLRKPLNFSSPPAVNAIKPIARLLTIFKSSTTPTENRLTTYGPKMMPVIM